MKFSNNKDKKNSDKSKNKEKISKVKTMKITNRGYSIFKNGLTRDK